jgi:hypothetical protein
VEKNIPSILGYPHNSSSSAAATIKKACIAVGSVNLH